MSSATKLHPLLQPYTLRHLTLKNRILSTSHAPNYVENGMPGLKYQLYHQEKAKGGMGMTMVGGSSNVSIDSPSVFGQINLSTDAVTPHLKDLSDRVHEHDCKIMCQLTHMGRRQSYNVGDWLPPLAPSPVREHSHRGFPKEMEHSDIRRIVHDFGTAARRCQDGGFDGVEVLASGHLVDQFLSPWTNRRSDEYGGSLTNRMRFAREVLDSIRQRVGDQFVVGIRIQIDEQYEEGYGLNEGIEICNALIADQMVDYLNANVGEVATLSGLSKLLTNMSYPLAPHLHKIRALRDSLDDPSTPLIHACRIMDVSTARYAIEEGIIDLVGMTRAHIADPYITQKLMNGQIEDIRPCVGAAYCIDRIYVGNEALCIHNAATGREGILPHDVDIPKVTKSSDIKKVVVIGGGIAGLESARICAIRGHQVVLYDANRKLGGQILLAAKAPWRRDLEGIVSWRVSQLDKFENVTIYTETYADAGMVMEEAPDVVICCTGGIPNIECIEKEKGRDLCVNVWDILSGDVQPKSKVLIFDYHGNHHALSCAEYIASMGKEVEIVTPDRAIGEELGNTNYPIHLRNLYRDGVKMTCDWHVEKVEINQINKESQLMVTLRNEYCDSLRETRFEDQVVVEHGTLPVTELFDELKGESVNYGQVDQQAMVKGESAVNHVRMNENGKYQILRVGDAMVCRNIHAAVLDALRMCKDL